MYVLVIEKYMYSRYISDFQCKSKYSCWSVRSMWMKRLRIRWFRLARDKPYIDTSCQ